MPRKNPSKTSRRSRPVTWQEIGELSKLSFSFPATSKKPQESVSDALLKSAGYRVSINSEGKFNGFVLQRFEEPKGIHERRGYFLVSLCRKLVRRLSQLLQVRLF